MISEQFLIEVDLDRERLESFDEYPFSLDAVKHLRHLKLHPSVTFIVGENGAGKSTLLEAIAVAWGFNAEGGSISFKWHQTIAFGPARLHPTIPGGKEAKDRVLPASGKLLQRRH
jgi:predicted ATPase